MSNTIYYENLIADVYTSDRIIRFDYVTCSPPNRLKPKGTVVLLHDFFKSSYQFRHIIDLFVMAGYTTIASDFPGRTISKRSSRSSKSSMRTLVSELSQFLHLINVHRPVHFVGVGFGAHIVAELAIQHSEKVASVTCYCDPRFTGDIRHLEDLIHLPTSTSGKALENALKHFFTRYDEEDSTEHNTSSSQLSKHDLAEYIAPFSSPGRLLDVQQASKTVLKSQHALHDSLLDLAELQVHCLLLQPPPVSKGIFVKGNSSRSGNTSLRQSIDNDEERYLTEKNLSCDPETNSESFAVAVLSYLHTVSSDVNLVDSGAPAMEDEKIRSSRL